MIFREHAAELVAHHLREALQVTRTAVVAQTFPLFKDVILIRNS